MQKIKDIWLYLVGIVGAIIGVLWYFLSLKNREVSALRAKLDLADTEKKSDLIEAEIKEIRNDKKRGKKELKEIDKVLKELDDKRKQIKEEVRGMSDEEIIDYWNK